MVTRVQSDRGTESSATELVLDALGSPAGGLSEFAMEGGGIGVGVGLSPFRGRQRTAAGPVAEGARGAGVIRVRSYTDSEGYKSADCESAGCTDADAELCADAEGSTSTDSEDLACLDNEPRFG